MKSIILMLELKIRELSEAYEDAKKLPNKEGRLKRKNEVLDEMAQLQEIMTKAIPEFQKL